MHAVKIILTFILINSIEEIMANHLAHRFLFFFLLFGNLLLAEPKQLKLSNVRETMDELFSYHVEYKELSPLIIKRAFKNYIEQFDRSKIYLLDSEVHPFIHLSDAKVKKIITNYQKEDYSDFLELNMVLQRAVQRAKNWRKEIQEKFVGNGNTKLSHENDNYSGYAIDEVDLKERIELQVVKLLFEEKKLAGLSKWTKEDEIKIFQLWEKRFNKKEEPYLIAQENGFLKKEKGEHFFCLHLLKAFAKSMDAHSAYFSPEEAEEMRTSLEKQFEGVGVVLREGIRGISIVELIKGSPADKSGMIVPGDFLVEIDGESISKHTFDEVLAKMKGKKTDLQLKIQRKENRSEFYTVHLKREKIILNDERVTYKFEPFGDGIIGKITLPSFYECGSNSSVEKDLREAIKELKKQGKLLGLILDLRDNSGGFLSQAVKVASLFIIRGAIVLSKYAHGEVKYMRDVDGRLYFDGPLILLASKASASASEIVAGALQDHGAALIVGDERTYGKGTIQYQTVTESDAKAYFKVTVGRYYTASGRSAQIEGIKADILVPTELANYNIGERFLEYPLPNDRIPPFFADMDSEEEKKNKNWLQKNYIQDLRMPAYPWQKYISYLSKNSAYRTHNDKNFSAFLKYLESSDHSAKGKKSAAWGNTDLQLLEAVNILKDMILLHNGQVEPVVQK